MEIKQEIARPCRTGPRPSQIVLTAIDGGNAENCREQFLPTIWSNVCEPNTYPTLQMKKASYAQYSFRIVFSN
jgi:hypothetical protein